MSGTEKQGRRVLCYRNDTWRNKSLMPITWQNSIWGLLTWMEKQVLMAVISEGSTTVSVVETYNRRNEIGLSQAVIVTFRITPLVSPGHVPETRFYELIFTIDLAPGDVLISLLCPLLSLCFLAVTERVNSISKWQTHGILQVHVSLILNSPWAVGPR